MLLLLAKENHHLLVFVLNLLSILQSDYILFVVAAHSKMNQVNSLLVILVPFVIYFVCVPVLSLCVYVVKLKNVFTFVYIY